MSKAVIVFSFPEPEDNNILGEIITKAKNIFAEWPDVKVHMAINDTADQIISLLGEE